MVGILRILLNTMRPRFIFAPIFLLTLFLGGCWHAPIPSPPSLPPSNGNTPTTTGAIDTSDWLTYVNYDFGFSFRYPKEWRYFTTSNKKSVTFVGIGTNPKSKFMSLIMADFAKAPNEDSEDTKWW